MSAEECGAKLVATGVEAAQSMKLMESRSESRLKVYLRHKETKKKGYFAQLFSSLTSKAVKT